MQFVGIIRGEVSIFGRFECKYLKFGIPYNFFMSEAPVSENESQKLKLLEVNEQSVVSEEKDNKN